MNAITSDLMKQMDKIVGQKLRELRTQQGMTQQDLAAVLDLSYQQVQKYESGTNRISAGKLYFFAKALGAKVSDFYDSKHFQNVDTSIDRAKMRDRIEDFDGLSPNIKLALTNLIQTMK